VSRRTDLVTTVGSLAAVLALLWWRSAPLDWRPLAAGAWGAVLLEFALTRRPETARRLWQRPTVRAWSVLAVLAVATVGALSGADWLLWALAGGLVTYLGMLGVAILGERETGQQT
jgi:uncharacterized membrane protein (DUF4010 family)